MLMASPDPQTVCGALHGAGIPAAVIGVFNDGDATCVIDGTECLIQPPGRDELFRLG